MQAELDWAASVGRAVARRGGRSDGDDLAQESMIAAWQAYERWDRKRNSSFRGYAWPAVRGAALMSVRREQRHEEHRRDMLQQGDESSQRLEGVLEDHLLDVRESPAEAAARAEVVDMLRDGIQALRPEAQRVLILVYFAGMSICQISASTGIPRWMISQVRDEGLADLRTYLAVRTITSAAECLPR